MVQPFYNAPVTADQVNPWNNLLSKALASYNAITDTRYKEPTLKEALMKSQLANRYYGQDKESEMALRAKQAEHLGSLTQGQNISNQFAPEKFRQQADVRRFGLEHPGFNAPGIEGQLQRYKYAKEHGLFPDMMENSGQSMENQSDIPGESGSETQLSYPSHDSNSNEKMDPILKSILDNKKNSKATGYLKALEDSERTKERYGENSDAYRNSLEYATRLAHGNERQINTALIDYRDKSLNRKHWDSLPRESKAQLIAIGQGAGMRPDEIENKMSKGESFDDILFSKGFDKDHPPEPIYQLTTKNISDLNNREYASREVSYLSDFIADSTGEYANRIKGFSPSQVKDALIGKNKEQQAKFLAARGLAPELVNLRLVMAGAKSTVSAQKQLLDKSLTDFKIFESLVDKDVYKRAQKIMDEKLSGAFEASKKGYGVPKTKSSQGAEITSNFDFSKYPVAGK